MSVQVQPMADGYDTIGGNEPLQPGFSRPGRAERGGTPGAIRLTSGKVPLEKTLVAKTLDDEPTRN